MLEDRLAPASSLLAVGADAGAAPVIKVYDQATGTVLQSITAFAPAFTGGVRVAVAAVNSLNATPQSRAALNDNLNAILAKVVGVLNNANLLIPQSAINALSPVLQLLALNTLVTAPANNTLQVLNLTIASPDNTTPPVDVNLLGVTVTTTSNIQAQLFAQTGDGLILGTWYSTWRTCSTAPGHWTR